MKRPEFIARQSARPEGLLGRLIAWIMARETALQNASARGLLAIAPTDRVLDVGFGHGYQLGDLARVAKQVVGVDHSPEMVAFASRHLAPLLDAGRVELSCADAAQLPFPDSHFDKALSVHTLYFWPKPLDCLLELRRVLKPGGTLVLGFRPREDASAASFPSSIYSFYTSPEVEELLLAAGLAEIRIHSQTPSFHLAVAVRPATP